GCLYSPAPGHGFFGQRGLFQEGSRLNKPPFEIINPRALRQANSAEKSGCALRADAPVCTNGNTDIACMGELYRGCQANQFDCANNPGNPDDACCAGWVPGNPGDNIDHAACITNDAPWGGFGGCVIFDLEPSNDDIGCLSWWDN